jgi:glycerol uptake facilitator protein
MLPIAGKGSSNWKYAWIPVVAPLAGGSFAAVFYNYVFKGTMSTAFWYVAAALVFMLCVVYAMTKKQSAQRSAVY